MSCGKVSSTAREVDSVTADSAELSGGDAPTDCDASGREDVGSLEERNDRPRLVSVVSGGSGLQCVAVVVQGSAGSPLAVCGTLGILTKHTRFLPLDDP
jgi:hypothetical protein